MQVDQLRLWKKSRENFIVEIRKRLRKIKQEKVWVATVNPEFVVEAWRDAEFMDILKNRTSYNVVDGNALLWVAKLPKTSLITGVDLMLDLCQMAEKGGYGVNFVGGWEDEATKTAEYFLKKCPNLKVNLATVPEKIKSSDWKKGKTIITFVALGMKKQEFWIRDNWNNLPPGLIMGVGRSFDYYAGRISRAPMWLRNMKLEWLYSALEDPRRARRQLRNLPVFVIRAILKLGDKN